MILSESEVRLTGLKDLVSPRWLTIRGVLFKKKNTFTEEVCFKRKLKIGSDEKDRMKRKGVKKDKRKKREKKGKKEERK